MEYADVKKHVFPRDISISLKTMKESALADSSLVDMHA